jgi:hypothetical protein
MYRFFLFEPGKDSPLVLFIRLCHFVHFYCCKR